MQSTTLADLIRRCVSRFDASVNDYITHEDWRELINEAYAHLFNWMITTDEDYVSSTYTFKLINNVAAYPLPSDFFKDQEMWGVTAQPIYSPSTESPPPPPGTPPPPYQPPLYWPIPRIMRREYQGGSSIFYRTSWPTPLGFQIRGQQLLVSPTPAVTSVNYFSLEMWYAPHFTALVDDTDKLNPSIIPGIEEFIINQVVINARIKEESDTTQLQAEQDRIKLMVEGDMMNRDLSAPKHVVDAARYAWPYGAWGLGAGWAG